MVRTRASPSPAVGVEDHHNDSPVGLPVEPRLGEADLSLQEGGMARGQSLTQDAESQSAGEGTSLHSTPEGSVADHAPEGSHSEGSDTEAEGEEATVVLTTQHCGTKM
jgi:hypothetical protein